MGLFRSLFGNRPAATSPDPAQRVEPQRLIQPSDVFTPSQPKTGRRLVGRETELQRILQALQQDRAHVVLYAERGRGKTSLSNVVVETLRRKGVIVARHICEAGTTFDTMMRGLMADLPNNLLAASAQPGSEDQDEGCVAALPPSEIRPRDIVALPQRLACRSLVCVLDEFDRVEDPFARTKLADTIKQLSDRDVPLLFLIVGVSRDLDHILGQHPSIQRSVAGVHLPLFSDRDIAQIIVRGGRETGFEFPPAAVVRITVLSRGMPYIAQLLGLRLTQAATMRGGTVISDEDFASAVGRMVEDAPNRVAALYSQLTDHSTNSEMVLSLRRVATAPQDSWGRLRSMEVENGVMLADRMIPKACWDRLRAAEVLQPDMPGSGLYSFAERGLMHHALLLAARDVTAPDLPTPDGFEDMPRTVSEPTGLHAIMSRS